MAKKLTATVHVHQDDGSVNVYQPGDDVPAADAKKITNEGAWEDHAPSKSDK